MLNLFPNKKDHPYLVSLPKELVSYKKFNFFYDYLLNLFPNKKDHPYLVPLPKELVMMDSNPGKIRTELSEEIKGLQEYKGVYEIKPKQREIEKLNIEISYFPEGDLKNSSLRKVIHKKMDSLLFLSLDGKIIKSIEKKHYFSLSEEKSRNYRKFLINQLQEENFYPISHDLEELSSNGTFDREKIIKKEGAFKKNLIKKLE